MDRKRGRNVLFIFPLILAAALSSQAGHGMRTVDFLHVFGAGMLAGVGLTQLFLVTLKKDTPAS
jgi:hypothetical protein